MAKHEYVHWGLRHLNSGFQKLEEELEDQLSDLEIQQQPPETPDMVTPASETTSTTVEERGEGGGGKSETEKEKKDKQQSCGKRCCSWITDHWDVIENSPVKYPVILFLALFAIIVTYFLVVLIHELILGLWAFTVWWTGSTAKATMTMIFCVIVALCSIVLMCLALYVPNFRESCCGSRFSTIFTLDYRDDCCPCVVHLCQHSCDCD
jgi:hypothetical protein